METDASDYALATILSIVNEDNEVHPVAFHSHTFTVACYKTKVWTDFRVRVRTEIRYSSSYIISLQ